MGTKLVLIVLNPFSAFPLSYLAKNSILIPFFHGFFNVLGLTLYHYNTHAATLEFVRTENKRMYSLSNVSRKVVGL